jgi:hypothetical protein
MDLQKLLARYNACDRAVEWVAGYDTLQHAWDACAQADWMVWWALRLDPRRKAAWRALFDIIESVLHLVPEEETRPRKAVETVRQWLDGRATGRELRYAANVAANAASAAANDAHAAATVAAYDAHAAATAVATAATAAANAAYAAADAAYAAADAVAGAVIDAANTADAAVGYAARAYAAAAANDAHAHIVRKHIPCVPWPSDCVVPSPAPGGGGRGREEE